MYQTEGRRLLVAWMKRDSGSQADLAKRLGVEQPSISRWVSGKARPEAPHREALFRVTGIDTATWLTADERKMLAGIDTAKAS